LKKGRGSRGLDLQIQWARHKVKGKKKGDKTNGETVKLGKKRTLGKLFRGRYKKPPGGRTGERRQKRKGEGGRNGQKKVGAGSLGRPRGGYQFAGETANEIWWGHFPGAISVHLLVRSSTLKKFKTKGGRVNHLSLLAKKNTKRRRSQGSKSDAVNERGRKSAVRKEENKPYSFFAVRDKKSGEIKNLGPNTSHLLLRKRKTGKNCSMA